MSLSCFRYIRAAIQSDAHFLVNTRLSICENLTLLVLPQSPMGRLEKKVPIVAYIKPA